MVQFTERNLPSCCGRCASAAPLGGMRRTTSAASGIGRGTLLSPERKISFDGFVNYEGRRFGVPYSYPGATARIMRSGDTLYIYSADLSSLLTTHDVTWSRRDSFCEGQYEALQQPEELPTAPVMTRIRQLPKPSGELSFAKFDFDGEEPV